MMWTEERRQKQSEAIQRWKPWLSSTGPKTENGKAKAAKNSERLGLFGNQFREIRKILSGIRRTQAEIAAFVPRIRL